MKRTLLGLVTLCLSLTAICPAQAAWQPTREIRILIPYNAGGQNDLCARKMGAIIQQRNLLPVNMIVVNMPGAATREALNELHKSKPDGYTLMVHQTALLAASALGQFKFTVDDLTSVCGFADFTNFLSVRNDAPWKNIDEMLAEAKKNPGVLRCAIPGVGGSNHFSLLNFVNNAKLQDLIKLIPTSGGAPAVAALMGKQVEMRSTGAPDMARFMRAGEERPLLLLDVKPNEKFPGVPDLSRFGIKQGISVRMGVFGPPEMPQNIVETLAAAFKAASETDDFKTFCDEQMATLIFRDGPAWLKQHKEDEVVIKEIANSIKE
ncbi:MAG: tripartite tricarboxylate transporter substrate binding protein [Desulfovibrionaceae bacterium]|nr:tripartite tricarboxylate transporter substrate binding protein [Desulfovibrionaceae bacterium]